MPHTITKSELDKDILYEINIYELIHKDTFINHLEIKPYPLSKINLNKDHFEDKELEIFNEYIADPISETGYWSECYLGKIKDEDIYFYIIDDPGASGYSCCGDIILYYSHSLNVVEENMVFAEEKKTWV